jgi:hypothetical protein
MSAAAAMRAFNASGKVHARYRHARSRFYLASEAKRPAPNSYVTPNFSRSPSACDPMRHGTRGCKELDEGAPMRPLAPGSGAHDKRETLKEKP